MLVLTRRPGQGLRIGEDVEVTVVRVSGDRVVVAVAAPSTVPVVRTELLAAVAAETSTAAASARRVRSTLAGSSEGRWARLASTGDRPDRD
ncbi:MAG TPA: carbon storage regulator [Candidatus Binatia bacterium]|nr:carbon storage regulator [Candidatus Binatia bacterium]